MLRALLLIPYAALLATLFWATTPTVEGVSPELAFGMPLACTGGEEPCWIAANGTGAIALGAGKGLVFFGWIGFGVFFAVGQLAGGLITIAQLGLGPVFFLGQVGGGLAGLGQLVFGLRGMGQAAIAYDGKPFLKALNSELQQHLAFRAP